MDVSFSFQLRSVFRLHGQKTESLFLRKSNYVHPRSKQITRALEERRSSTVLDPRVKSRYPRDSNLNSFSSEKSQVTFHKLLAKVSYPSYLQHILPARSIFKLELSILKLHRIYVEKVLLPTQSEKKIASKNIYRMRVDPDILYTSMHPNVKYGTIRNWKSCHLPSFQPLVVHRSRFTPK